MDRWSSGLSTIIMWRGAVAATNAKSMMGVTVMRSDATVLQFGESSIIADIYDCVEGVVNDGAGTRARVATARLRKPDGGFVRADKPGPTIPYRLLCAGAAARGLCDRDREVTLFHCVVSLPLGFEYHVLRIIHDGH